MPKINIQTSKIKVIQHQNSLQIFRAKGLKLRMKARVKGGFVTKR